MKRLLAAIISIILVCPSLSVSAETENSCSEWAVESVAMADAVSLVDADKTYSYSSPITREGFCELIYSLILKTDYFEDWYNEQTNNGTQPLPPYAKRHFDDTDNEAVDALYEHNIVYGKTETEFAPNDLLTREEAATIIVRMVSIAKPLPTTQVYYNYDDIEQVSDWASVSVQIISNLGFMKGVGDNKFAPKDTYTTEQAIVTVLRVYNAFKNNCVLKFVDKDGNVILTEDDVVSCDAIYGEVSSDVSEWYIELILTADGQEKFKKATNLISKYPDNQISIFFEGVIISAPKVMSEIDSDTVLITGEFTEDWANDFESFFEIPLNLYEAYNYFDENLIDEDIEYIKNSSDGDLSMLHFSLGLWIRNNWIYPSKDGIAKEFLDNGVDSPDNMSGLIIYGYKLYLNGQPCSIEDVLQ